MKDIKQETELLKSIMKAKQELLIANKNFEGAEDELIDYYSYQIKASKAKLNYLIKQVKQKKLKLDVVNYLKMDIERIKVI
ncbi:MAG: DUF2508 family protein [Clostridia bacterium]|nr:DUF2508 family protein [Clostridia bacterium]